MSEQKNARVSKKMLVKMKDSTPKLADIGQNWLEVLRPFSNDYSKELTVKEISEATKIPIRSALRYLESLSKSHIIKVETKGKNKIYHLNLKENNSKILINLIEYYKSISYKSLPRIWVILSDFMRFGDFVLFGSYAKGYANEKSDLDILILSRKSKKAIELAEIYPLEINLHFSTLEGFKKLLKSKNPLAVEIVKGHVVFGSSAFIELCWRFYKNEL